MEKEPHEMSAVKKALFMRVGYEIFFQFRHLCDVNGLDSAEMLEELINRYMLSSHSSMADSDLPFRELLIQLLKEVTLVKWLARSTNRDIALTGWSQREELKRKANFHVIAQEVTKAESGTFKSSEKQALRELDRFLKTFEDTDEADR